MTLSIAGPYALSTPQFNTADIEVVMLALESQRTNLLDDQLRAQMKVVKTTNDKIAQVNGLLAKLAAQRPSGSDVEKWGNLGSTTEEGREVLQALKDQGLDMPSDSGDDLINEPGTGIYDAKQKTFDVWTEQLKRKLDTLNSTQQMDMIQLQSLSSKRSEAYELLTNFQKKFADMHSSVIQKI